MIEPALYFLLGFLSSTLLALMIGPAIWSRAVRLTRRRIEASQPLSLAEIKADRDQLRADFAVNTRRLELNISDLRTKFANQRIEVGRAQGERDKAINDRQRLMADIKVYERELTARGAGMSDVQAELRSVQVDLNQRNNLIDSLEIRIRELNAEIEGQKLEISSLTSRIEASGSQMDSLAEARRLAEARIVNLTTEIERRGAVITAERNRADRLLADLGTLKKVSRLPMPQSNTLGQLPFIEHDDNERPAISRLEAENAVLEARLRDLADERDKLSFELQTVKVRDLSTPADAGDIAMLKDRLGDIAARIATLTPDQAGVSGLADQLVANFQAPPVSDHGYTHAASEPTSMRLESLAEKIEALRAAATQNERA